MEWWVESAMSKSTGRTALIPEVGGRTVKTRTTRAGRVSSYEEVRLWLAE